MNLTQIDLIRILEGVEIKLAVDAILSSIPYQSIVKSQEDLTTAIENLIFDQVGDLADLVPEFKTLFGQNIRSLVAYVSGNPLAAGSDYPSEDISLATKLFNLVASLFQTGPSDEEIQKLTDENKALKSQLSAAQSLTKSVIGVVEGYFNYTYKKCQQSKAADQRMCGAAFYLRAALTDIDNII